MTPILITSGTVALMGLICGVALALAARFMAVKEDPRVVAAEEILPAANCGGCGYAGCADYAKAIVLSGAPLNQCPPGGPEVSAELAALMGVTAEAADRKIAIVLCGGDSDKAPRKQVYDGVADCAAAHAVGGGDKKCAYGCLGYGSCARACPVGAIEMTATGLAYVHSDICIGCNACVKACPRGLIQMIPDGTALHVLCSSKDKGPIVKKACEVGCIGCRLCVKHGGEAFEMDGFLALRNYEKPVEDEDTVIGKCPGKCIIRA
jgi:Na+-translocating ferredoxin:NAD+ oxidoreductase subunit B